MYSCADCAVYACRSGDFDKMPLNCPMREREKLDAIVCEYKKEDIGEFHRVAAIVEKEGYCKWPRVRETMEFARRMGYKKLGVAFCVGFKNEAKILAKLLRQNGFEVVSVACKCGGYDKNTVGVADGDKIRGGFEAMCNPITQAELMNQSETEFNIALGLCVGHDSLFYRYSNAMVTTLVAKDRAMGHNPAAALYLAEGYCKDRVNLEK